MTGATVKVCEQTSPPVRSRCNQGISFTTREKVVDLGPIQMSADKTRTIPLPPIVGGIAFVGGIALLVVGRKRG